MILFHQWEEILDALWWLHAVKWQLSNYARFYKTQLISVAFRGNNHNQIWKTLHSTTHQVIWDPVLSLCKTTLFQKRREKKKKGLNWERKCGHFKNFILASFLINSCKCSVVLLFKDSHVTEYRWFSLYFAYMTLLL